MITRHHQPRRLFHHLLNHLAHRLEVFFLGPSELVHVEMIPRQGVFLRRLALIEAARTFIHHELLSLGSAVHSI